MIARLIYAALVLTLVVVAGVNVYLGWYWLAMIPATGVLILVWWAVGDWVEWRRPR